MLTYTLASAYTTEYASIATTYADALHRAYRGSLIPVPFIPAGLNRRVNAAYDLFRFRPYITEYHTAVIHINDLLSATVAARVSTYRVRLNVVARGRARYKLLRSNTYFTTNVLDYAEHVRAGYINA
jgi:hypothetical protein